MTTAVVVKLSSRNQMVLPKEARAALGVESGDRLVIVVDGNNVQILAEPDDWSEYIYGLGEEIWDRLGGGEHFLAEERASWEG